MSLNNQDRKDVLKEAEKRGYRESTDGSKLIHDNGKTLKISPSGGSVQSSSAGTYTSSHDLKESDRW